MTIPDIPTVFLLVSPPQFPSVTTEPPFGANPA